MPLIKLLRTIQYVSILLLLMLVTPSQEQADCDKFPKVIGGINGETRIFQLDYNTFGNTLSAIGYTKDSLLSGQTQKSALIYATTSPYTSISWAKIVKLAQSQFTGIVSDSDKIFAFLEADSSEASYIVQFKRGDGTIENSYKIALVSKFQHLNPDSRSMLYDGTSSFIYYAAQLTQDANSKFVIVKASLNSHPNIAYQLASNSISRVLGIAFNWDQSKIFVFQANQDSFYYASAFYTNNFANIWNTHFTYDAGGHKSHGFDYNVYSDGSGDRFGYFAIAVQYSSSMQFGRIKYKGDGTMIEKQLYTDSSSPYQQKSFQDFKLIIYNYGVFLLSNNMVGFITYNSKNIKYQQVMSEMVGDSIYFGLGKIVDYIGNFFAPYSSNKITGPKCEYTISKECGFIISSYDTCQKIDRDNLRTSTLSTVDMLDGVYTFEIASDTITITSYSYKTSDIQDLIETALYSTSNWQQTQVPILPMHTQFGNPQSFNLVKEQTCYASTVTGLTTTNTIDTPPPLPVNVTFDYPNQQIMVTKNQAPGTYDFQMQQVVHDGLNSASSTQKVQIIVTNTAPSFVSTSIKTTYKAKRGIKTTYSLPQTSDPESNPVTIELTPTLPTFVSIDQQNHLLVIEPSITEAIGSITVFLRATDQYLYSDQPITIQVLNSAPYIVDQNNNKVSSLGTQVIRFGIQSYFTVQGIDPEGSALRAAATTVLPSFITLNPTSLQFTFYPQVTTDLGTQTIKFKVFDDQLAYSEECSMDITVANQPPQFLNNLQPVNQQVHLNTIVPYKLPQYYDPEGSPLTVTHTSLLPSFITFADGLYFFSPNDLSYLGQHYIAAEISDGYSSISYSFVLTVVNYAPYFGVKSLHLSDILDIVQGEQRTYNLPDIQDIESLQVKAIVTIQGGESFIKYDEIANQIMINASRMQCIGTFTCNIQLQDATNISSIYYFQIRVNPQKATTTSTNNIIQPFKNESRRDERPAKIQSYVVPNRTEQKYILAKVTSISVAGVLTIRFNTAIQLPENNTNVNISNLLALSVIPHKNALPSFDKRILSYNLTNFNKLEMTLQINFSSPLQISPKQVTFQ